MSPGQIAASLSVNGKLLDKDRLTILTIAEVKQILSDETEKTNICWVKSENMLSDCLTKKGANSARLCEVLENGFIDVPQLLKDENEKLGPIVEM